MTPDIGQMQLKVVYYSHILSPREEDTIHHTGPHGCYTQEQSEIAEALGCRVCSDKRMG